MELTIDTSSYNEKRYGKPWIANVDFASGAKPNYSFGEWIGQPGDEGKLILHVEPGAIVARGQKDFRGKNSAPSYYAVTADGELEPVSKVEAYERYQAAQEPDNSALEAERARLVARIAEIDAQLGR